MTADKIKGEDGFVTQKGSDVAWVTHKKARGSCESNIDGWNLSCSCQHKSYTVFAATTWCQGMRGSSPFTFHTSHNRADGKVQHTKYVRLKKERRCLRRFFWADGWQIANLRDVAENHTTVCLTPCWRWRSSAAVTIMCNGYGGSSASAFKC